LVARRGISLKLFTVRRQADQLLRHIDRRASAAVAKKTTAQTGLPELRMPVCRSGGA